MQKLALITVHGMGSTPPKYYGDLIDGLRDRLGPLCDHVIFEPVYYQKQLQENQHEIFARMRPHLDSIRLREFLLYGFSDAASLEHRKAEPDSAYTRVQKLICDALDTVYAKAGNQSVPVVIVAQSLGCQVVSNYTWDAGKEDGASAGIWKNPEPTTPERDSFRRLHSLHRFITTGCNIPIFVAGHKTIKPFAPKAPDIFKWLNYYDEDDALGWPLRPLNKPGTGYDKLVTDVPVNAGGGLLGTITSSWNPMSHSRYWQDSEVQKAIAKEIKALLP